MGLPESRWESFCDRGGRWEPRQGGLRRQSPRRGLAVSRPFTCQLWSESESEKIKKEEKRKSACSLRSLVLGVSS